ERNHLGLSTGSFATSAWTYVCAASSCLHAINGCSYTDSPVGNCASNLRPCRRSRNSRPHLLVGHSLRLVRRSVISSDGSPLRGRAPICLVWFFRCMILHRGQREQFCSTCRSTVRIPRSSSIWNATDTFTSRTPEQRLISAAPYD